MINIFTNHPNHDRQGVEPFELSKFPSLTALVRMDRSIFEFIKEGP
jgi:hypothetical protein